MLYLSLIVLFIVLMSCVAKGNHKSQKQNNIDPSKVVVVMSRGTSGSTELCGIVSHIVNSTVHGELFGSSMDVMREKSDPLKYMLDELSKQEQRYPGQYVGFKYKPYFHNDAYEKVLNWFADNKVKIVYNVRNPLDVVIGGKKKAQEDGVNNCHTWQPDCVTKQQAVKIVLDISDVLRKLEDLEIDYMLWYARIKKAKLNVHLVTYEGVNHGTMQERLAYIQTLANFINPMYTVTEEVFEVKSVYVGHYHQNETVTNYAELETALKGTRYERYLH